MWKIVSIEFLLILRITHNSNEQLNSDACIAVCIALTRNSICFSCDNLFSANRTTYFVLCDLLIQFLIQGMANKELQYYLFAKENIFIFPSTPSLRYVIHFWQRSYLCWKLLEYYFFATAFGSTQLKYMKCLEISVIPVLNSGFIIWKI